MSVPASRDYYSPANPFLPEDYVQSSQLSQQQSLDDQLYVDDVIGKRMMEERAP